MSIQHRLMAALCYWLGLLWIPILLEIAQLSIDGGLWKEFGGKPMAVVFGTFFLFPPLAVLSSISCQIIYWRCLRQRHPHVDLCGCGAANLGFSMILALLFLLIGVWVPVIGGYFWPWGLWVLLLIYSLGNFLGGLIACYGKSLDLPREICFFR